MNPMTAFLVAEHMNDLMREAEDNRRARLVNGSRDPRVPAWRRVIARSARSASVAFGVVASRLEPAASTHERQPRTEDRTPALTA